MRPSRKEWPRTCAVWCQARTIPISRLEMRASSRRMATFFTPDDAVATMTAPKPAQPTRPRARDTSATPARRRASAFQRASVPATPAPSMSAR